MTPYQLNDDSPELPQVLTLIRSSFAYMDGRIDPPSSMHRLTVSKIAEQCRIGEVWAIGTPPIACVFLTPQPDCLYVGKLAVAEAHRRKGLAQTLIGMADHRARALDLPRLELETRVELTHNHTAFAGMGFIKIGETSHDGYQRATSITMSRKVERRA
ncbi:MAG: GNAT family N-acetyltransferase [Rhodobacteraceae bacterium]|nr:GNAT family N-acetyltransferase [Paracoccaceae bacterium]